MTGVPSASNGTSDATSALVSIAVCVVAAPIHSASPRRSMPRNSAMRPTSTRCANTARRNASIGTRLCPPASTLASSPCSASSRTASTAVVGAWYSKGAGFTGPGSDAVLRDLDGPSAVDRDDGTGDERRAVGGEERGDLGDLVRLSAPLQRRLLEDA